MVMGLVFAFSACKKQNNFNNHNQETQSEKQADAKNKEQADNSEDVVWDEVSDKGVDEDLLIKNIDEETLTYIAHQLQDICSEIIEKQKKDKFYNLTGWYNDVMGSEQYSNVISLGKKAMKPLFLIIYKSPSAGFYEWVCSKALTEISGFDFSKENNGAGWSNSKEFLEMFIQRLLDRKK